MGEPMDVAEPHPWNTDFTWQTPGGPFRVLDDEQAAQFDRDGYVVLDGVLDAEALDPVTAELDRAERQIDDFLRAQDGGRVSIAEAGAITFATHVVAQSPVVRAFAAHPVFAGLCADLVGPDVNLYWDQAVYKKPEKPRRFPWHQDNGYSYVEPQQYLTCWVALTDATVENGCPWVVPGVHRRGTLRHEFVDPLGWECFAAPEGAVAAPVAAGGVVVFSSLTPHLTGPNTTDGVRKAYILQYAPAGARVLQGDPSVGPPTGEVACDDPDRQFPIVRAGREVATR
ncbi:MAG TPA: phytanoyl-CoA dioxygenase family protein [Acidimicrobiales bacterium]|nr:phytanoyl-CoA dioxygenase family protein [Acidimicrobiales bacterium]